MVFESKFPPVTMSGVLALQVSQAVESYLVHRYRSNVPIGVTRFVRQLRVALLAGRDKAFTREGLLFGVMDATMLMQCQLDGPTVTNATFEFDGPSTTGYHRLRDLELHLSYIIVELAGSAGAPQPDAS